jgi:hypothetical protein
VSTPVPAVPAGWPPSEREPPPATSIWGRALLVAAVIVLVALTANRACQASGAVESRADARAIAFVREDSVRADVVRARRLKPDAARRAAIGD